VDTHVRGNLTGLARALAALEAGKDGDACYLLEVASERGSPMAAGLLHAIAASEVANAYDQPHAFELFIRGGGNRALYEAVSSELTRLYETYRPHSLLDIGAGDGMALAPAIRRARNAPSRLDVVEPNGALLARLASTLPSAQGHEQTLQAFVASLPGKVHWHLAQSTFALQSIPPAPRRAALSALAGRVDRLVIVEFDVPDLQTDTHEYYESLAARYDQAASDCGDDADVVARGFLAPMLLGQLRAAVPSNYEQPARAWAREVAEAGYRVVRVDHVHAYSWADAFLLEAVPAERSSSRRIT